MVDFWVVFFGFALLVRVLVDLGLTGVVVLVCV